MEKAADVLDILYRLVLDDSRVSRDRIEAARLWLEHNTRIEREKKHRAGDDTDTSFVTAANVGPR